MPNPGDSVLFHLTPMHVCGGGKALSAEVMAYREKIGLSIEFDPIGGGARARGVHDPEEDVECLCAQEATGVREATVVSVLESDPGDDRVALELDVALTDADLALGYAIRQSCSFEATLEPPESGAWTVAASKAAVKELVRVSKV